MSNSVKPLLLMGLAALALAAPSAFAASQKVCAVSLLFSQAEEQTFGDALQEVREHRADSDVDRLIDSEVLWVRGASGLNTCLDPTHGFEGVYIVAHSGRVDGATSSLLLRGEDDLTFAVPDRAFSRIARSASPAALKRLGISTCYSSGLRANYPRLFSLEGKGVSIQFSNTANEFTTGESAAEEFFEFLHKFRSRP